MFKKIIMAAVFLAATTTAIFGQKSRDLTVETLISTLKSLGIYADNKVTISGQAYLLKNVSVEKGKSNDEFVIKFTAKPMD
jgi:hypothetical protein